MLSTANWPPDRVKQGNCAYFGWQIGRTRFRQQLSETEP
jgi:hypothetical protein